MLASAPRVSRCRTRRAGRRGPAASCISASWSARSSCRRRSGRTRCGSACSPARPCSRSRTARSVPLVAVATVGVALLYLQWLPAVRAVAEAHGDPSTRLAFQAEARDFLAARGQARRARRGAADHEPLGGRGPRRRSSARARLGAPARRQGQPALLRRRAADRRRATTTGCARTRCAGSRCRTRRWTTPRGRGGLLERGPRTTSSPSTTPALAHLGAARPGAAGLWRRDDARRRAELVHGRPPPTDGRHVPLHAVLVHAGRVREPRAGRVDRVEPEEPGVRWSRCGSASRAAGARRPVGLRAR